MFIVAESRLYRDGLARCLAEDERIVVVGTAASASETAAVTGELGPDLVLLDVGARERVGELRALHAGAPAVPVVVLGLREIEHELLACAEAGVAGYVALDASVDELVTTIESASRGEMVCSPQLAATLLRHIGTLASELDRRASAALTSREVEIVALIDQGLSNREIASKLCIELPTVKNHVHNILAKLQVSRRGAAAAAVRAWV